MVTTPNSQDTIYAPATLVGRSGVTITRISGPAARVVISKLCRPAEIPPPRQVSYRGIYNPTTGEIIDRVLILYFEKPQSYTGEDCVEIHSHGGKAVAKAVLGALGNLEGMRPATEGEFTRRAFLNGKLDLTEVEAVADIIHADTEKQRRQALRQFEGDLGRLYEGWREQLTHLLAYQEATIDFSDEDLPNHVLSKQKQQIQDLIHQISLHLNDGHRGERLREGFHVAILGPPNAGKSSLLNALARREAAIVSAEAGTTRDPIEVHLDLNGYPVTLIDTAGLRAAENAVEQEGIARALNRARSSDLNLILFDGETWPYRDPMMDHLSDDRSLLVINKADLPNPSLALRPPHTLLVSATRGDGLDDLKRVLKAHIESDETEQTSPLLTRHRHRIALNDCSDALSRALQEEAPELRCENLRLACNAVGSITGQIGVEDLLDVIFSDFCIGK